MLTKLMFGQKPIMSIERTITSLMAVDWMDEMNREGLLAAQIRQLEQRSEDVERAKEKLCAARVNNKGQFDRTYRLWPKKIEESDWVLVYDTSLDSIRISVTR